MVIEKKYFMVWSFAFLYFCWGMSHFGLVIDTDDWGILLNSQRLLDGYIAGDPNKTFSLLVGLLTVFFGDPQIFPFISSLLGAWTCLGVYRIIECLTGNRLVAILGWAIVLISPMLLWQVLSCNSISFMTCFLVWALYYFVSENYLRGCWVLSLASLVRPEPMFVAVFLVCFMAWKVWKRKISERSGITFFFVLAFPPLWWMGFNELAYGRPFYSLERVHQGGQVLLATFNPDNFLAQFWSVLKAYYLNVFAASFSIVGIFFLITERKKLFFLYAFSIVSFLGLWVFVSLNFALIERFLLPLYIYLIIFGAIFLNRVLGILSGFLSTKGLIKVCSIGICMVFFLATFPVQAASRIKGIMYFHSNFDHDLPAVVELLKREVVLGKPVTVLVSARRIPFLSYHLYSEREIIMFVSFRKIYQDQSDWSREGVDFVILAPNDMFPPKSAVYNLNLSMPKGLVGQGLEIAETIKVSPLTSILKVRALP
jgi:hypothetical protein